MDSVGNQKCHIDVLIRTFVIYQLPTIYRRTIFNNMALNWAMLTPNRTPEPLPHEMAITNVDSGVEVSLSVPDAPPTVNSMSGGSGGVKKLKGYGKLYLTDQRVSCSVTS